MALKLEEVRSLVQATLATRPAEIGCDDCLAQVAAYAERELAGLPASAALRLVEEHVGNCPECREEYEALLTALRGALQR
jgi:hypothetical protein